MNTWHGPEFKGAMRLRRAQKRHEAEERQAQFKAEVARICRAHPDMPRALTYDLAVLYRMGQRRHLGAM